jgi:Fic family protein
MDYIPLNRLPIIDKIEGLKEQLDSLRPLLSDVEGKIFQKLRIDWNYHSNAIEGNQLTRGETVQLIMQGITAKGKPFRDHLDIKGHNDSIDLMFGIIKDNRPISEIDIKQINQMLLKEPYESVVVNSDGLKLFRKIIPGQYKTQPNHVKTVSGEIHYYTEPQDVSIKMKELIDWLNIEIKIKELNPLIIASVLHHKFVAIHPFDDGNGRTARILMNLILIKFGYTIIVLKNENKLNYYGALELADEGEYEDFINLLGNELINTLKIYLSEIQSKNQ